MLVNEDVDELVHSDSDAEEMSNSLEQFCLRLGISRYNQIVSILEVALPLLLGLGVAVGIVVWIRTDSFMNFITV
jgi:hypothetical protein